mmetsp:Transcript_21672/g.25635  ORF Transcript_21672/g.25635 Transcript_21672/m.25635 type:complete len:231 (+) Transcript_21672:64-756(+)
MSKYPSTQHLPFSPGLGCDDVIMTDPQSLIDIIADEVIITEKLDGGNCCISNGVVYARTHKHPATHPWFGTIKQMFHLISATLEDPTLELFGENLTAIHSIEYGNLESYFYLFGVRRMGVWLCWDEVVEIAEYLSIPTVPLRFRGKIKTLKDLHFLIEQKLMIQHSSVGESVGPEGFVVRMARSFNNDEFERCIAKYVRPNHIQTGDDFSRLWPKNKARLGSPLPIQSID